MTTKELFKWLNTFPDTSSKLIDYDGQEFYNWQGNKLGNDLFLSDPDRAERIHEAAENGADGSTHAEIIDDMREYADELYDEFSRKLFRMDLSDRVETSANTLLDRRRDKLTDSLDNLELWHENNGSLHQEVG